MVLTGVVDVVFLADQLLIVRLGLSVPHRGRIQVVFV